MNKTIQYGWITPDGKLEMPKAARKRMDADLKAFPECDVEIVIKKRGKRSLPQNAYYWSVIIDEIRREFLRRGDDFTPDEIHEGLKAKFNPKGLADKESGEALFITGNTTTEMNKEEFGAYLDRIIIWASQKLSIEIPLPSTQTSMFNSKAA